MFRPMLGSPNSRNLFSAVSQQYNQTQELPNLWRKEINRVTLVGTVFGDQHINNFGQKMILVRTVRAGTNNYEVHVVHTTAPFDLESGQRVFVDGSLSTKQYVTSDDKKRNKNVIKSQSVYILNSCEANGEADDGKHDLNSIDLLATICADIFNKNNHSILTLVSHSSAKNNRQISNFHVVFIRDRELCNFVRKNLQKNDRIYLRGHLSRNKFTDDDGKWHYSGFINAEHINKIKSSNVDQSAAASTSGL